MLRWTDLLSPLVLPLSDLSFLRSSVNRMTLPSSRSAPSSKISRSLRISVMSLPGIRSSVEGMLFACHQTIISFRM